jgi:hypothetical protein
MGCDGVRTKARLWLTLSLLAAGITLLYRSTVLLPWEDYVNEHYLDIAHGRLKAQLGDLYPRWIGTRELLLNGRNPYSSDVSHEIQLGFYGHPIEQNYDQPGTFIIDEQRFAYPVYVVFLLAPAVHIDFALLQRWSVPVLALLTAISVLLWMDILRWRPPWSLVFAIVVFVLTTPQVMQGLRLRQIGLLVAFLLSWAAWCIVRNHLVIAGVLLAISTIKPQMALLPLAWFLLWAVSVWPKRWPLLLAFGITLGVLIGLGELVLPGWLRDFIEGLAAYRKYFPTTSLLRLALGNTVGWVVSVIAFVGIFTLAWRRRLADSGSPEFIHALAASLICAAIVLPLSTPYNQVLLLLPVIMILLKRPFLAGIERKAFAFVLAWPYVWAFLLLIHPPRLNSPQRLPLLPSALVLFVPFLVFLLFATGEPAKLKLFRPQIHEPRL